MFVPKLAISAEVPFLRIVSVPGAAFFFFCYGTWWW